MDKINKYIEKFATESSVSQSGKSVYYQIGDKVLRVSDHIGKNSDGAFQIIVRPNGYLIYHPASGTINICDYRQVQEFVRVFNLFPINNFTPPQKIIMTGADNTTVLGVPISAFSINQEKAIRAIVKKICKKQ